MNILLAYCSPNKTTQKLSFLLRDKLAAFGHTVNLLNMGSPGAADSRILNEADAIGIGAPVYQLRLASSARSFLLGALPRLRPQTSAFIYLTYGGISSGRAFENTLSLLSAHQIGVSGALKVCAPHSFSTMPFPDGAVEQLSADFCAALEARHFAPFSYDETKRKLKCRSTKAKIIYPLADAVGKLRHLPVRIDTEACTGCGRCARECPAAAIVMNGKAVRNSSQCIHCYRCASVCAAKAIICPLERLEDMVRMNKKILGLEQPQNEILI